MSTYWLCWLITSLTSQLTLAIRDKITRKSTAEAATQVYTGWRSSAVTVTVCKLHKTQLDMAIDQWLCDIYIYIQDLDTHMHEMHVHYLYTHNFNTWCCQSKIRWKYTETMGSSSMGWLSHNLPWAAAVLPPVQSAPHTSSCLDILFTHICW